MNDYFDFKVWHENNYIGELLKSGFNKNHIVYLCIIPISLLCITMYFSNKYFLILITYIILFYLYQASPCRLKNHYFYSIVINSLCLGTIPYIYPYLYLRGSYSFIAIIFSVIFFFYLAFHEIIHQIAHLDRDKIYSLPKAIGIEKTVKIAVLFLIGSSLFALLGLVVAPIKNLFFSGTIIFSLFRIRKILRIPLLKEKFKEIRNRRDKFYSFQEGIYYSLFLLSNKLWK